MTPSELIAEATAAVEREDFTTAHDLYLRAWGLIENERRQREAAASDRARLRDTVIQSAFFFTAIAGLLAVLRFA